MAPRRFPVVLVLGCVALAWWGEARAATGRERHEAVYPPQSIPLYFDHGKHLEEGAECEACHEAAPKSVRAKDRLVPPFKAGKQHRHDECDSCHEIDKAAAGQKVDPASDCETCHVTTRPRKKKGEDAPRAPVRDDEVLRTSWPVANLVFNHKVHAEKKIECVTCHFSTVSGTMKEVGLATRYQLPKMEVCTSCHDGQRASAKCQTCHLADKSGRLQLSFSTGALRPSQGDPFGIDHGPRYEFNHGRRARLERQLCLDCHVESQCMTCHDSLQKPLAVHPNDYVTVHPIQARQDSTQCDACHRFQSFCAACHERVGVGLNADPSFRPRNAKVHPDYTQWVDLPGPNHHGIAASRDIKQCIACHREESCTACHATQATNPNSRGLNPHPARFDAICKGLVQRNDRGCLKCHTSDDLTARGCR